MKTPKKKKNQSQTVSTTKTGIFAASCILLAYPAYFRGLYFTSELLIAHIITSIIFLAWRMYSHSSRQPKLVATSLDLSFFFFIFAYLISSFFAINLRGAIEEFLKVSNFFIVYMLIAGITENKKNADKILNVMLFSASGIAILGLGALSDSWQLQGGLSNGRIFSTLQYANSLAAYLTAAFFIALGLRDRAKAALKNLYNLASFVLVTTLILTYSRGGWLIAIALIILYMIMEKSGRRYETAGFLIFISATSMISSFFLAIAAEHKSIVAFWFIALIGAVFTLSFPKLSMSLKDKKVKIFAISAAIALFALTGIVSGVHILRTIDDSLILTHPLAEPKTEKLYMEHLSVMPSTDYRLSMDLNASGYTNQPFGWRVRVIGAKDNGQTVTLLNVRGERLNTWEKREFSFKTPEDVGSIVVQLVNAYPGIELTAKNIYLIDDTKARELRFIGQRLLPDALYRRIISFRWHDNAVQERLRFFRDALAIIRDYPLFGLGGQGWQSRYFQYQSVAYLSKEIHNHFLQVWVDAGILAFISFIGIIMYFLLMCIRINRKTDDYDIKSIILTSAFAFFAIIGHSTYDFNLSMGAIGIFIAALMGVVRSFDKSSVDGKALCSGIIYAASISLSIMMLPASSVLYIGRLHHTTGHEKLEQNNITAAARYLEMASRFDRYCPIIRTDYAVTLESLARAENDGNLIQKAENELKQALILDRYHPRSSLLLGQFLIRRQRFEEGLDYIEESLYLNPRFARAYIAYARNCINIAVNLYFAGEREKSLDILKRIFEIESALAQNIPNSRALALYIGKAHFMLGEINIAKTYLEKALAIYTDRAAAAMTLAAIYAQAGNGEKEEYHFNNGLYWDQNSRRIFDVFIKMQ